MRAHAARHPSRAELWRNRGAAGASIFAVLAAPGRRPARRIRTSPPSSGPGMADTAAAAGLFRLKRPVMML